MANDNGEDFDLGVPPGFIVLDDEEDRPNLIAVAHIVRYFENEPDGNTSTIVTTDGGGIVVQASEDLITNYIRRALGVAK